MKPVDHIARFIAEVRAEPELASLADEMERALHAVDCEGDTNVHAAAFFSAVEWVLKQPRTIREKLDVICKLTGMKGKVVIPSMQEFSGWQETEN
jgi:hypothetical protein